MALILIERQVTYNEDILATRQFHDSAFLPCTCETEETDLSFERLF